MVETYGELNQNKDNAVLVCHAFSGNHHAAGIKIEEDKPGWWDQIIGDGKTIDTSKYFVVSVNNLGGCNGSSGPIFDFSQKPIKYMDHLFLKSQSRTGSMHKKLY